jgi:WD40 repeat protein
MTPATPSSLASPAAFDADDAPEARPAPSSPAFEGEPLQVWRHKARVSRVVFSPDGQRVASASDDLTARVWKLNSEKPERVISAHLSPVFAIAFAPCGTNLLTVGYYCNCTWDMKLWSLETGDRLTDFEAQTGIISRVAFSPDGRRLLTGNAWRDHAARVWDVQKGEEVRRLADHSHYPEHVAFSPRGDWMATGEAWGEKGPYRVALWEPETGELLRSISLEHDVRALAASPDGQRLAVASGRLTPESFALLIFDAQTGQELRRWSAQEGAAVAGLRDIAFLPDGQRLAACGEDGHVRLWDSASGQEILHYPARRGVVESVAISPAGDRLAAAGDDGAIRLWELPAE